TSRTGVCADCHFHFCLPTDAWGCFKVLFPKPGIGNDLFVKSLLLLNQRLFLCRGRRAATAAYLEPCGRRTILCVFPINDRNAVVVRKKETLIYYSADCRALSG